MTFDGIPIFGLTAPAILGIAVLMLFTGRLIPRSVLKDKQEESERWRLAYEAEREARLVSDNQTAKLLIAVETNRDVLLALFKALNNHDESGGPPHVASED
jgi:hypothetical protein